MDLSKSWYIWHKEVKIIEQNSRQFGNSVHLNNDGSMLVIGGEGTFWIYKRKDNKWSKVFEKLVSDKEICVNINTDGTIICAGDKYNNTVWIYEHYNSEWICHQTLKIDEMIKFGTSIVLSSNGNTLCIGASDYNDSEGCVYIYIRDDTKWLLQKILKVEGCIRSNTNKIYTGSCLALNSDANTLVIGSLEDSNTGSITVFN